MPKSVEIQYNGKQFTLELPPTEQAERQSKLILSLPKAGSTLLANVSTGLARTCGYGFYSLANEAHKLGIHLAKLPEDVQELFVPQGYVFGGFREFPRNLLLPEWAPGNTIALVRDPRDMLTSLYFSQAYSHRPPGADADDEMRKQFEQNRERMRQTSIDDAVIKAAPNLLSTYETLKPSLEASRSKIYRYEDVIFDKTNWLKDIVSYLDLPVPEPRIINIAKRFDVRPDEEKPDEHVRKATPGDHKEKLRPETIERLNQIMKPMLDAYNYPT